MLGFVREQRFCHTAFELTRGPRVGVVPRRDARFSARDYERRGERAFARHIHDWRSSPQRRSCDEGKCAQFETSETRASRATSDTRRSWRRHSSERDPPPPSSWRNESERKGKCRDARRAHWRATTLLPGTPSTATNALRVEPSRSAPRRIAEPSSGLTSSGLTKNGGVLR